MKKVVYLERPEHKYAHVIKIDDDRHCPVISRIENDVLIIDFPVEPIKTRDWAYVSDDEMIGVPPEFAFGEEIRAARREREEG